jgi:hypothetical protein
MTTFFEQRADGTIGTGSSLGTTIAAYRLATFGASSRGSLRRIAPTLLGTVIASGVARRAGRHQTRAR